MKIGNEIEYGTIFRSMKDNPLFCMIAWTESDEIGKN